MECSISADWSASAGGRDELSNGAALLIERFSVPPRHYNTRACYSPAGADFFKPITLQPSTLTTMMPNPWPVRSPAAAATMRTSDAVVSPLYPVFPTGELIGSLLSGELLRKPLRPHRGIQAFELLRSLASCRTTRTMNLSTHSSSKSGVVQKMPSIWHMVKTGEGTDGAGQMDACSDSVVDRPPTIYTGGAGVARGRSQK